MMRRVFAALSEHAPHSYLPAILVATGLVIDPRAGFGVETDVRFSAFHRITDALLTPTRATV